MAAHSFVHAIMNIPKPPKIGIRSTPGRDAKV